MKTPSAPYQQVMQYLKQGLATSRWAPGVQMPSEAELVDKFGVSRMTVNRALRELQTEGLVQRIQGVGTFAAQLHKVSSTLTIRDLHEEVESRGGRHELKLLLQRSEVATQRVAQQLGVSKGVQIFRTVIVHYENGQPLQLEDRVVNPMMAPDYLGQDFTQTTPTRYLLKVAPLWQAHASIEACAASAGEAKHLGLATGDPCLVISRRTMRARTPITFVRLVHPGVRYQIEWDFSP